MNTEVPNFQIQDSALGPVGVQLLGDNEKVLLSYSLTIIVKLNRKYYKRKFKYSRMGT